MQPTEEKKKNILKSAYYILLFFVASGFSYVAFADPPGSPYAPGGTLDPSCTPGSANCTVSILPSGSSGQVQFNSSGSLGGSSSLVWDNTNARLGIGTTSPYAPLSVVGEAVAAYFTATTTATSTFAGGLNVRTLNVTSSSATSTFANGINLSAGCFSVNGTCVGGSSFSGSGSANALAYWTGASSLSYNSNFVLDNTNGRLGIGTTSPYSTLSVAGQVVGQNFIATSTTATSTFNGGLAAGTGVSPSGLVYDRFTGNVGIGTAVPDHKLYVQSTAIRPVYITSGAGGGDNTLLTLINTDQSWGDTAALHIAVACPQYATAGCTGDLGSIYTYYSNINPGMRIAENSGNPIYFNIGGGPFSNDTSFTNTKMTLDSNGNLGIGTTSPTARLSVYATSTSATMPLFETLANNGSGTTTQFVVTARGSLGLGTTSPYLPLSVAGQAVITATTTIGTGSTAQQAGILVGYGGICVDNDGTCTASTTGRVSAVSYTTGSTDLAENYTSTDTLQPGDIVMTTGGETVGKADGTGTVIGIVSTKPGIILGLGNDTNTPNQYPVALAGRVPVKVSLDGGEIKKGDRITLSSTPGIGQKATSSAYTVGIALEDFNSSTQGTILVFVNLAWGRLDPAIAQGTIGGTGSSFWSIDETSGRIKYIAPVDFNDFDLIGVKAIMGSAGKWSIDASGKLVVDELEVRGNATIGSPDRPSGVTLYDKATGAPYCLSVAGGVTQTVAGTCGNPTPQTLPNTPAAVNITATSTESTTTSTTTKTPPSLDLSVASSSTTTPQDVTVPTQTTPTTTTTQDVVVPPQTTSIATSTSTTTPATTPKNSGTIASSTEATSTSR